jgi:CBS domain-containing protein
MLMTEVAEIFEDAHFHNLPVVDANGHCVGIISKSDVLQLQDKFTKFNHKSSLDSNRQYFDSLLVREVMTPNPVSVHAGTDISELVDLFIERKLRSLIVLEDGKCIGIVTPFDILVLLNEIAE